MMVPAWLAIVVLVLPLAVEAATPVAPTGLQRDVTFAIASPRSRNDELLRRLRSPLTALRVEMSLANNLAVLHAQPLDPAQQRFALYVPPGPPPSKGYALLVFVPPWDDARVPAQWTPVLNRDRTIFVSAAHSGNDADVFNRREPLALLAEYNVAKRYRVNPSRVYVGGFSGGSRVALRIALGYPDVFHGALLDAGSDPIGTAQIPLPPADLFHRFQQSSQIVFLTGDRDAVRQAMAAHARESLQRWCVSDTVSITLWQTGHALADTAGFSRALDALSHTQAPDAGKLASCNAGIESTLDSALQQARSFLYAGRFKQARNSIEAIDARYGGLAAPQSVELMRKLDTQQ